jgi:hypothetical protein
MLTAGRYDGPAAKETLISCPDEGCVTFRIERHRWMPSLWEEDHDPEKLVHHR